MSTQTIRALQDVPPGPYVVTIGNFDGVHRGHQHLIGTVVADAKARGAKSLVMTFEPLPTEVLRPDRAPQRLNTTDGRLALIAALDVDIILLQRFDLAFAGWSAREFVERLVAATHPVEIVVGEDFAFGHDRAGNPDLLRAMGKSAGFETRVVERVGESSSTRIRALIAAGDVAGAAELLGHSHVLSGTVEPGARRGRTLGFPTANLAVPANLAFPPDGIYAAFVAIDRDTPLHEGIAYIGPRPTFDGGARTVEVYLLDFDRDLYGSDLTVLFIDRVRGDARFESVEALIRQMRDDEARTREILARTGDIWPWNHTAALIGAGEGAQRGDR